MNVLLFYNKEFLTALSGIYYNWGKCGKEIIRTPKPTSFESFVEIYAEYFKITNKAINLKNKIQFRLRIQVQ
jgi:hypothetical protein